MASSLRMAGLLIVCFALSAKVILFYYIHAEFTLNKKKNLLLTSVAELDIEVLTFTIEYYRSWSVFCSSKKVLIESNIYRDFLKSNF